MSQPAIPDLVQDQIRHLQERLAGEREACAKIIEDTKMGDILLALGEMTAQERRTCKALQTYFAHKIRSGR